MNGALGQLGAHVQVPLNVELVLERDPGLVLDLTLVQGVTWKLMPHVLFLQLIQLVVSRPSRFLTHILILNGNFSGQCNTDYPGNAITAAGFHPRTGVANGAACQALCAAQSECTHFTFGKTHLVGNCWLKTSSGTPGTVAGLISGPKSC